MGVVVDREGEDGMKGEGKLFEKVVLNREVGIRLVVSGDFFEGWL